MSAGKFNVIYRTVVSYVETSGSLMGYRAMHQRLRERHGVRIPRYGIVHVNQELDLATLTL